MGLVSRNVALDHPDFGKAFTCPTCGGGPRIKEAQARNMAETLKLLADHGVAQTPRHDWLEWGNFSRDYLGDVFDGKELAVALVRAFSQGRLLSYDMFGDDHPFAKQYPTTTRYRPTHNLLIHGPVGVGKTALAALGYRKRLNRGGVGVSVEWSQLYTAIRGGYSTRTNKSYRILQAVVNAPVLFLDDLGDVDRGFSDDQARVTWEIVNGRYSNMRPTIITTNLNRVGLGDLLGHKISGRLAEAWVFVGMGGAGLREYDHADEGTAPDFADDQAGDHD